MRSKKRKLTAVSTPKGRMVVQTTTNEFYFPCRLLYRVLDYADVIKKLGSIRCIGMHPHDARWCIHCCDEALESVWSTDYLRQVEQCEPVVIGTIRFVERTQMHVYLRCFERVVPVLQLIDKYLPRTSAVGTHIDICYELVTASDPSQVPTPEEIFAVEKEVFYQKEFAAIDALEEKARTTGRDYSAAIDEAFREAMKTLPHGLEIEDLHRVERKRLEAFYADGPEEYKRMMKVSATMGLARYQAGGSLKPFDFFKRILAGAK